MTKHTKTLEGYGRTPTQIMDAMTEYKPTDDEWETILRALCSPDPVIGVDSHSRRCAELYEKIKQARSGGEEPPPPPRKIIPRPQFLQKDGEDALKWAMKRSPGNPFVKGCAAFLAERGFLSDAQIEALKRVRRDDHLTPPDARITVHKQPETYWLCGTEWAFQNPASDPIHS
jgi:hypothetical protein